MSNWESRFQEWLDTKELNITMKEQLLEMRSNQAEIKDAFNKPLPFIDSTMYGMVGPGINRINIYTLRKAMKGLACYIEENCVNYKDRGVVINYDFRLQSKTFALEVAKVLGVHHIKSYVFDSVSPTPLLPFAVTYSGAVAGIMITGDQYPLTYNGFKLYNELGSPFSTEAINEMTAHVNVMEDGRTVEVKDEIQLQQESLLHWIKDEVVHAYLGQLITITKMDDSLLAKEKDLKIVCSPLPNNLSELMTAGLNDTNFKRFNIMESSTSTTPEFLMDTYSRHSSHKQMNTELLKIGEKTRADLLLALDSSGEHLDVAVKADTNNYRLLSSDQLGGLLLDYMLMHTNEKIYNSARILKTIEASEFGRAIAHSYGVQTIDLFPRFSNSGMIINNFNATGETFIFGHEENNGYVMSNLSRSKDAIQAALITCEMTQFWKDRGMTLLDALHVLYNKHGYFKEGSHHLLLDDISNREDKLSVVRNMRERLYESFGDLKVKNIEKNFIETGLNQNESVFYPKEYVIKYNLEDESWICLVLSETTLEINWYYSVRGEKESEVDVKVADIKAALANIDIRQKIIK